MRDLVAILTWGERQVLQIIGRRAFVEISFSDLPAADQAAILQAGRALPLPALLEQHQATHRQMLDALRTLTGDELNAEEVAGLPPDERFWKVIAWATWWSYPSFAGSIP